MKKRDYASPIAETMTAEEIMLVAATQQSWEIESKEMNPDDEDDDDMWNNDDSIFNSENTSTTTSSSVFD